MFIEVDIGHKRPDNLPLEIGEQELTFKGEVVISIRPATITPITKANVVYFWLFQEIMLVVMGDLDIGHIPATIPPK